MKVFQNIYQNSRWEKDVNPKAAEANLVLYFGSKDFMKDPEHYHLLRQHYPKADVIGCSTGGEIIDEDVHDETIVTTALQFDHTQTKVCKVLMKDVACSQEAGHKLGEMLQEDSLAGIMVFSDGTQVNGTDLAKGMREKVSPNIPITGGLAGDGDQFQSTLVAGNDLPEEGAIVAVGFYGDRIQMGHGSYGGWDTFGPQRLITRSDGNVLYELDGKPALALYKKYLGAEAENLPGSALLFPLTIYPDGNRDKALVRTILGVDEKNQSMTFAGDVPQGHIAQLMRGDIDNLIEGASLAAKAARFESENPAQLAILVSCIGRKLLMGQRIADEIEAVKETLGDTTETIGFYSYGELCPKSSNNFCELHNQTMTITTLSEIET